MYLCMNDCVIVRAMSVLITCLILCHLFDSIDNRNNKPLFNETNTFTLVAVKNVPHKYFNFTHKKVKHNSVNSVKQYQSEWPLIFSHFTKNSLY